MAMLKSANFRAAYQRKAPFFEEAIAGLYDLPFTSPTRRTRE